MDQEDRQRVPKGSTIRINGLPLQLLEDAFVASRFSGHKDPVEDKFVARHLAAKELLAALGIDDTRGITRITLTIDDSIPVVTIDRILTRSVLNGLTAQLMRTKSELVQVSAEYTNITGRESVGEAALQPSQEGRHPVR